MSSDAYTCIALGLISLLLTVLFIGEYRDPKNGDREFFIKHRPTFKHLFYSPAAFHRYMPVSLSAEEKQEESAFNEFIIYTRKMKVNDGGMGFAVLFVQISLSLLVCGSFKVFIYPDLKIWQLIVQFLINIFITGFCLVYILLDDIPRTSFIFSLLILAVNILTAFILVKAGRLRPTGAV
jgi:hypothetical protein